MSVTVLPVRSKVEARMQTPEDLVAALGIDFSDQQLAAITAPLEPGVIIAGAGSGKTTVMAARVVWLVGTAAVRPEEVLGLTFTRKAAAELSARVRAALLRAGVIDDAGVDDAGEQLIMTYDAFAARLVTEHGLRVGVDADATMITGATRFRLASRVVRAAAGPFEHISRLRPATVTERVLKLDADLQQHLVDPNRLDTHARGHRVGLASAPVNQRGNVYVDVKKALLSVDERLELASLVRDYQQLKQHLGVVEFADQMAIAARLAVEVPEVSDQLRTAFRVVLLDEYQDTSAAQAIMLRGLFSGHDPLTGRGHPVTAVGDPFQAIYGWRGAAASNILQFSDHFRRRDGSPASRFALTVNRRSGPTILGVANELARPLRTDTADRLAQLSGEVGTVDLDPLRAPEGTRPGQVRGATFETWDEEVSWVADQIQANRSTDEIERWSDVAVLTRRNLDIGPIYAELTARDIPTEIVGLGGLLSLPEVMDVVATLRLVDDVTANPDLVRLLGGPRWSIGPRDLALLGRRARELAQAAGAAETEPTDGILHALEEAVADVDPTDVISLVDALEDPIGDPGPSSRPEPDRSSRPEPDRSSRPEPDRSSRPEPDRSSRPEPDRSSRPEPVEGHSSARPDPEFSAEALRRFARLAGELAYLRRHSDEPLLDLCRRVITTLGLDVELSATSEYARTRRRDQLGAFLDAVADYVDVDGQASLSGLLAYLRAEVDQGNGLDQAVPSAADSVKLLTVHKAKGLEWEVVYLPALMQGTFPSDRVSDNWVTGAAVLPADLRGDAGSIPQLADSTATAIKDYARELKDQQLLAEDRLAYVAVTRARSILVGSGHTWRAEAVKPRVPSSYLKEILAEAGRQGSVLAEAGPPAAVNPLEVAVQPVPWPKPLDPDAWDRRREAAQLVRSSRDRFRRTGRYESTDPDDPAAGVPLMLDQEEVVASWDADIAHLLTEARAARVGRRAVPLPATMSASALLRLRSDAERFAAELARPMPSRPSAAARFGTRFHQWVEQHLAAPVRQPSLLDPDDAADEVEVSIGDEGALRELCERFAAGPFGSAVPYALESPISVLIGGRVIRGRIDAVYRDAQTLTDSLPGTDRLPPLDRRFRYRIVDWKTAPGVAGGTDEPGADQTSSPRHAERADPWQLAIYRLAWAELSGVALDEVDAVFYFVGSDTLVRPSRLADRAEIERVLLGGQGTD